jgi:hypothetical protein
LAESLIQNDDVVIEPTVIEVLNVTLTRVFTATPVDADGTVEAATTVGTTANAGEQHTITKASVMNAEYMLFIWMPPQT